MFCPSMSTSSGLFADNTCSTRREPRTVHRRMHRWPRESGQHESHEPEWGDGQNSWTKPGGQIKRLIHIGGKKRLSTPLKLWLRKRSHVGKRSAWMVLYVEFSGDTRLRSLRQVIVRVIAEIVFHRFHRDHRRPPRAESREGKREETAWNH